MAYFKIQRTASIEQIPAFFCLLGNPPHTEDILVTKEKTLLTQKATKSSDSLKHFFLSQWPLECSFTTRRASVLPTTPGAPTQAQDNQTFLALG
jgi:hypothetical protein